ncbi:MAG: dicarboxylate/amino acid:cation symporter [Firmicutes bacterium]|nr:dicarboxylate/amino acid:cation symporter [Bacillota bacterium]
MPWYKHLYWQIIIGLIAGLVFGIIAVNTGLTTFTTDWIKPWGVIFVRLLKMVAIPMILTSLICGVASLCDLTKLSRIGGKTIALYVGTTVIAIIVGLFIVNFVKPGKYMPQEICKQLRENYAGKVEQSSVQATETQKAGPLQPIVDIVPDNFFKAASDNGLMLQMVFAAMLLGVAAIKVGKEKAGPVIGFLESLNEVVLQCVELIMKIAPLGVFAQISSLITDLAGSNPVQALHILKALGVYVIVVLVGLFIHCGLFYSLLIKFFTPFTISRFFRVMRPAQIIAFSTSSSAATLPVNMERCEKGLKIPSEVTSFTLPLGATFNMDGTSLYQAVAAVFIAQVLGMNLTMADQLTIVLTATLASIGSAGVPGAGVVMLVIVLQAIHVPIEGIALILGVDRILDMFRTVVNITGDAVVTSMVAKSEGLLKVTGEDNIASDPLAE